MGQSPPQHSELERTPSHFNHIAPYKILAKRYTVAVPPRYLRHFDIQLCQTSVTKIHASDGAVVGPLNQPWVRPRRPVSSALQAPILSVWKSIEVPGVGGTGLRPSLILWYQKSIEGLETSSNAPWAPISLNPTSFGNARLLIFTHLHPATTRFHAELPHSSASVSLT